MEQRAVRCKHNTLMWSRRKGAKASSKTKVQCQGKLLEERAEENIRVPRHLGRVTEHPSFCCFHDSKYIRLILINHLGPEVRLWNNSGISEAERDSFMNFLYCQNQVDWYRRNNFYSTGRSASRQWLSTGNFLASKHNLFPQKATHRYRLHDISAHFCFYLISYRPCQFVHPRSCLCNLLGSINDIWGVLQGAFTSVKYNTVMDNLNKPWKGTILVTLFSVWF